eukprot:scaffold296_cov164-Ochromonas_danica.AAC.16
MQTLGLRQHWRFCLEAEVKLLEEQRLPLSRKIRRRCRERSAISKKESNETTIKNNSLKFQPHPLTKVR